MKRILEFLASIEKDKLLHFTISLLTCLLVGLSMDAVDCEVHTSVIVALVFTMFIGTGKEIYDEVTYNGADVKDLIADVAGGLVGVLTLYISLS